MVLAQPKLKKKLEDILHPEIAEELNKKIEILNKLSPNAWLFYEASLILETGKKSFFDACVVITSKSELRFERLSQSRSLSIEEINKIIGLQMPDEEKILQADYVIENSGDILTLEKSALNLIHFLYEKFTAPTF